MTAPKRPTSGAEVVVEAMYFVGMMFWIWGVPGSMVIVSDAAPNMNAAMKRCQERLASLNRGRAIGITVNMTTNRLTPP